jgi:Secretion system C-terminal sorting domain
MKKILLLLFITALILLAFFYAFDFTKAKVSQQKKGTPSKTDIKEVNKQEELELRGHHEFIMTVDPKLGYVPTERLFEGEKRAGEIMQFLGRSTPSVISALTWTERGPNNIGGRTRALLFDQNDATGNTALAGGVGGGLWRTTNFKTSANWTQIASINQNLAITCIAQDPQTLNTMYAGTGEGVGNGDAIRGLGVYKSTDAGLTWTLLASTTTAGTNINDFSYVQKILVYNNATHDVYAACRSAIFCNAGGLMRSANGGTSWSRVIGTYPGGSCIFATDYRIYDIEKSFSGDLWVSSISESVANSGKIWKSPAGATVGNAGTWVDKTPPAPGIVSWKRIELACSPTNNNRVYALLDTTDNVSDRVGGIRRTDDGAATPATSWVNVTNTTLWCDQGVSSLADFSRRQAWYDLTLAIKPDDDNTVFAAGVDIMKTTTGGVPANNWVQITQWASGCTTLPNVHADIHNIQYLPGSATSFVVACDGGLYYTTDGGATFTNKNTGYNITQYYSCAIHPAAGSNYMLAGAQDNGTHKFTTAGMNTVTTPTGGDGGFCVIDQKNPLQQITNFTGTSLNISKDGGTNFTGAFSFATDRFINPGDFDTASSTTPALSTAALYYCGGAVQNFRRATINFSTLSVTSNSFAVGTATANHSVSAIKVDPNIANRIWVAMSTADNANAAVIPQLYYINNANTVTPISNAITLPATITSGQYISSIDIESGNASHALITISNYGVASVYESTDLGATWTSLDNNSINLPDVPVRWGMFIPVGYTQAPASVGGILLATELGVWGSNTISAATTPWAQNTTGMGNVRTDMIKLRGADKVMAVATHGRGLFTGQLNNLLPVDYVWFKGAALDKSNRLYWKIANAINNSGFEVQRKYDGNNQYAKIGFVPAGNNPSVDMEYSFDDNNVDLLKQAAIYRLKQIDNGGNFKYSDQISVKRNQLGKLIFFVSASKTNLLVKTGNVRGLNSVVITIYNAEGKILISRQEKYQDINLDISSYPSGNYFIKLKSTNTGEESINKFIK